MGGKLKSCQIPDIRIRCPKARQGRHLTPHDWRTTRLAETVLDNSAQIRIWNINRRRIFATKYLFAKATDKNQKIGKFNCTVAIQIILDFILLVPLT